MAGYFEAGETGEIAKLQYYVEGEKDLMVADGDGMTLLHLAAQSGHLDACRILVNSGRVEIEAQDRVGRTPLHWACHEAHVAVGRYLESAGASTDVQDHFGRTPLSYLPQKARMTGDRGGPENVPKIDGLAEAIVEDTLQPGHTVYAQGAVAQAARFHTGALQLDKAN